ncbi:hypothetical protein MPSEU_000214500 [Mayamaea pseudoterrestris]|nr:hypothetical protein MPSEU_000214500 [Mayamaea pseudoterrestris]
METSRSTKKHRKLSSAIPVVVVESHQHVLEHIHHVLRRKNLLSKPLYMLHFDAHADLACPMNIPAKLCFQPRCVTDDDDDGKDLYERLDLSSTGIAEWILPLALAANLRSVDWIRQPSMFEQLPIGDHSFHIGIYIPELDRPDSLITFQNLPDSARLRVDWNVPYYRDDAGGDACVATEDLVLKQEFNLRVADLTTSHPPRVSDHWILDICLDYFCPLNPFISDLHNMSNDFTTALDELFRMSILSTSQHSAGVPRAFQTAMTELLRCFFQQSPQDMWSSSAAYIHLCGFFETAVQAQQLVSELQQSLENFRGDKQKLISAATEAMPYWTMPHSKTLLTSNELLHMTDRMCQRIRLQCHPPFIITIARSALDGFTSKELVDDVQHAVLEAIHSLYNCACLPSFLSRESSCCCFEIIYDYGEREGSSFHF